jgi:hypothetical protein
VSDRTTSAAQISPIAGVGSNASELVVPCVEQTNDGVSPAARSAATISASAGVRIAYDESWGTTRRCPRPAMRTSFSMLEWACAELYATCWCAGAPAR